MSSSGNNDTKKQVPGHGVLHEDPVSVPREILANNAQEVSTLSFDSSIRQERANADRTKAGVKNPNVLSEFMDKMKQGAVHLTEAISPIVGTNKKQEEDKKDPQTSEEKSYKA
jgi:hypothetical protein